jgi:hypothetical protein
MFDEKLCRARLQTRSQKKGDRVSLPVAHLRVLQPTC